MAKKKSKKKEFKPANKSVILLAIFILFIVVMAIFLSSVLSDYSKIRLSKNNKEEFNVSNLTIDNLNYMSNEKDVIKKYGDPKKESKIEKDGYKYKVFEYDELKITLREYYDTYVICKVETTSNDYVVSGIKVGNSVIGTINKFKVSNKKSNYLYGNYSSSALEDETITDNIKFGKRTKTTLLYVNRDEILKNVDMPSNIAKLTIKYKHGRVRKITWSYDFK